MYTVQLSKSRKAYQDITRPRKLNDAHDVFVATLRFKAPEGAKVRLVNLKTGKVVRTGVATGTTVRDLWEPKFGSVRRGQFQWKTG